MMSNKKRNLLRDRSKKEYGIRKTTNKTIVKNVKRWKKELRSYTR